MSSSEGSEVPSVMPSLHELGFGRYLDDALQRIIFDNRNTIHDIVDDIIAKRMRQTGKGQRKANSVTTGGAPHTRREPTVKPTAADLRHSCFTTAPTRSFIEPIGERASTSTTVEGSHERAHKHCRQAVQRIIDGCKEDRRKFFDESFYFDRRANLYPDGSPDDCTVAEPVQCARLRDLFPSCPLFADAVSSDDIMQGAVGDCFFIGAVSALAASRPTLIQELFAHYDEALGVYGVCFFKCGGWEWVVVDDMVPVVKERSGALYPLFASASGERVELWPLILEKAYAKLHYNWDMIDGGWAREALVDLTGGLERTIDFAREGKDMTFDQFHAEVLDANTVIACAVGDDIEEAGGAAAGRAGEQGTVFGLFKGHQYAVVDSKKTSDGQGFLRVRNPWGNDAEWTGPYADNAPEWTRFPLHRRELNPLFKDDGAFWIRWEDFRKYLSTVDVVRTFPDDFKLLTLFGDGQKDLTPDNTYILHVCDTPTPLVVAFGQDDPKMKYGAIGDHPGQYRSYGLLQLAISEIKEIPAEHEGLQDVLQGTVQTKRSRDRAITITDTFEPGVYVIRPSLMAPDAVGMYLRIIGPPDADYALHRWSDGESTRLVVGSCPLLETAKGLGVAAASSVFFSNSPQSTVESPPGPQRQAAEAQQVELAAARRQLLDANMEVERLRMEVQRLQSERDSSARRPVAPVGGSAAAAARQLQPQSPWERLHISKARWNELVGIVYREVSIRDMDDAINAVRLLVTTGTALDDLVVDHPLASVPNMPLATFAKIAGDAVLQWRVLGETVPVAPILQEEEL